ncbi:MAG: hypothetical protein H7A41_02800 [Chlamydiales bacterium]|nr:hypothetical protein [Chlamydiia bacterium]MCP5504062.1 hypothetical protein [Chlamydiales bacterium]
MTEWTKLQEEMQAALSKEIKLRQEILGNMNQQEYLLLIGDMELKQELYNECNLLVKDLKEVIKLRGIITRKLFDHLPSNIEGTLLDEILDPLVDIEEETLLLYQKTKELIDKIHAQQLRNKTLLEMISKEGPLHVNNRALQSESVLTKKGKKAPLITIDYHPEDHSHGSIEG